MHLDGGEISLCLNVRNLQQSIEFYERLGFSPRSMHEAQGWAILTYDKFELGLFEGHIDKNLLNFRGADLYKLEVELRERSLALTDTTHIEHDGSQALNLVDPDGNVIYFNTFPAEAQAYRTRLEGLHPLSEVILYVEDMQAQVEFYRDVLGLNVTYPTGLEDYAQQYWVTFATGECTLALHGGGQKRIGQDAPKIVFTVWQIHAARERLIARGLALSEVRSPAPGILVSDGQDPEGNAFSLESRS